MGANERDIPPEQPKQKISRKEFYDIIRDQGAPPDIAKHVTLQALPENMKPQDDSDKLLEVRLLESAGRGISAGAEKIGEILEELPLPPMESELPEGQSGIEFRGGLPVIVSRRPDGQDFEFNIAENLGLVTAAGAAPAVTKGAVSKIPEFARKFIRGRPQGPKVATKILGEATESNLTPSLKAANKATSVANRADDAVTQLVNNRGNVIKDAVIKARETTNRNIKQADEAIERITKQSDDAVKQAGSAAMQGKGTFSDIRVVQKNADEAIKLAQDNARMLRESATPTINRAREVAEQSTSNKIAIAQEKAVRARETAKVSELQATTDAEALVTKLLKQEPVSRALQKELISPGGKAELRKMMPEISEKNFNSMMRLLERGKFQEFRNRVIFFGVAYPLARWLIVNPIVSAIGVRERESDR